MGRNSRNTKDGLMRDRHDANLLKFSGEAKDTKGVFKKSCLFQITRKNLGGKCPASFKRPRSQPWWA